MTATIQQALAHATATLREAGIETAHIDARVLLGHIMDAGQEELIKNHEKELDNNMLHGYRAIVARRQQHEPIAHIVEKKEFWSLDFAVSRDTLIPRPETETLIETALQWFPDRTRKYTILDLGTGTGCLLITLLRELPQSSGIGIDISTDALAIADANAHTLCVHERASFTRGNWAEGIKGRFDIIVSNPPYIAAGDIAALDKDVAVFEPHAALVGGEDGLEAYRTILPQVSGLLKEDGIALFEIGQGQAEAVKNIAKDCGLGVMGVKQDLAGIDRCIIINRRDDHNET